MKYSLILFLCLFFEISSYADVELCDVYADYSLVLKSSDMYLNNQKVGFTNHRGDSMSYEVCDLMFRNNLCAMCLENDSPYPKDQNPDYRLEELRTAIRKREGEFIIRLICYKDYESVFRMGIDYMKRLDELKAIERAAIVEEWFTNIELGEKNVSKSMLDFISNSEHVQAEIKSIERDNTTWEEEEMMSTNDIVIGLPEYNYLYRGLKTMVKFAVSDIPQVELGITVRNGKIMFENNHYFVVAGTEKECEISLYRVVGADSILLGSNVFRVKPIPDPVISLAADINCQQVSKHYLNDFKGLRLIMPGFDFNYSWKMLGYTCKIEKSDTASQVHIIGPAFSPELQNEFKNLQPGDKVHFLEMTIAGKEGEIRKLQDVVLHIVN